MMKKILLTLMYVGMMISLLAGCSQTTEEDTKKEVEKDAKSLIFEAENVVDALSIFGSLYEEAENEEEKEQIQDYMNEYFLNDINGYLYYEAPSDIEMHVRHDERAIYVKSREEVYIIPYSEKELKDMKLELEDIPQMENSEDYKYYVSEIKSFTEIDYEKKEHLKVEAIFKSYNADESLPDNINSIRIFCYATREAMRFDTYGYFADEINMVPEKNKENDWGAVRAYYKYAETASIKKSEHEQMIEERTAKYNEEPKEPALGMTKSEIENSSWGKPDKKNIDEYEWGIEEQWVYNRGYIYFEDGIVTGIQHR